jgi:ABC-type multidrug transport system fused ATPase/permease subunit
MVLMNLIGQRAMLDLRDEIYAKLQTLSIRYFDRNPVGRLMTRLTNDVEVLNQMFTQGVVAIFGDLFTLIGIMVVLVILDWRLALVTFSALPLLIVATMRFRAQIRGAYRDIRVALARINAYLQEALGGIAVIKSLRREARNEEEFEDLATTHRDAFLRSVKAFSVYYPLVEIIEAVAIALVLWYGGGRILQDALTFGALVAFIQYAGRFFRPIRDLSEKYNILQDAMASSERIFGVLDEEPERDAVEAPDWDPRRDIRFEDVHFGYAKDEPVIRGVSFEVPAGKTTAIVGSTGAGKTTLVGLLTRFYAPDQGRITIGGVDLEDIPRRALRTHMAIVQQDVFLFAGTVEENIRLGEERFTRETIDRAVALSHTSALVDRLPQGLASEVTERGGSFSTGERQLVAFARALTFDPDILILDEATASVDSETEALIQDALSNLIRDRTAIVIAHRLSTIQNADQILVLHHGRVCERGTHQELLNADGVYARLYRLQFQLGDEGAPASAAGGVQDEVG